MRSRSRYSLRRCFDSNNSHAYRACTTGGILHLTREGIKITDVMIGWVEAVGWQDVLIGGLIGWIDRVG